MIDILILMLAGIGQEVLTDSSRRAPKNNPDVRRAILLGKPEPRLKPVNGLICRDFLGYSETQMHFNLQTGDTACSGEIFADGSGGFRQVNYLSSAAGLLPVIIFSPRSRIDAASRMVIYLNGGPRSLVTNRPLAQRMMAQGYTVLMPIYRGELETRHPEPDLSSAVRQVRALSRWAGKRLVATIGVSTGGYLAAAACTVRCPPRILLAPPLTTPAEGLSDSRVDWSKVTDRSCLWRQNGPGRVCADIQPFQKSFWGGTYYHTSLASLLRGRCAHVRIIVSTDDKRVYDPKGVADLRAAGCAVETPHGFAHEQADADPVLNERTLKLVSGLERP